MLNNNLTKSKTQTLNISHKNMLSTPATVYTSIHNPKDGEVSPVKEILNSIQNGKYKELVEDYRRTHNFALKLLLPHFITAEVLGIRRDANVKKLELIFIDFDDVPDYEATRIRLSSDSHLVALFESPTKGRLKGIMRIEPIYTIKELKALYPTVMAYFKDKYNLDIDPSGSNMSRVCFVSYDPDIHINENAIAFKKPELVEAPAIQLEPTLWVNPNPVDGFSAWDVFTKAIDSIFQGAQPGSRHDCRMRASYLTGGYIAGGTVEKTPALSYLKEKSDSVADDGITSDKEWWSIKSGVNAGHEKPITLESLRQREAEYQAMPMAANGEVV